ncbi:MAG: NAD-dependent epimerase/dehydratase family protein [Alphaproteobacteria bacterium]
MKILVTGAAGFIGMHMADVLCKAGHQVLGIDNLNDYYSVDLKKARLAHIEKHTNFKFEICDLSHLETLNALVDDFKPEALINLAAQAGVRYSLENPHAYAQSNLVGFLNVLECCRNFGISKLVYASSSSVYGANKKIPFSETDQVATPVSLYAATKLSNEMMASAYSHLYGFTAIGLRFFTVYGPWGRPDMAPWLFTEAILNDKPISVFNQGKMRRDFTYIDDIVNGVKSVLDLEIQPSEAKLSSSLAKHQVYNIGNNRPIELMHFISVLEKLCGKKAQMNFKGMQDGDVVETYADIDSLNRDTGYLPTTNIEDGMAKWVEWYRQFHKI